MIDVQISPEGVQLWRDEEIVLDLTPAEFEQLAVQVNETHANKQGFTPVTCRADEARIGDQFADRQIVNVRPNHPSTDLTTINTKPFGWMIFNSEHEVTVMRRIA